ncbi:MAG: TSUP family transporter [Desulfobacterales bacterium]|nr:TSUP family transporter [Desulfobacterales bacterium]
MNISLLLFAAIFFISLLLTMVGLGGGLIFSPLFVVIGFPKAAAASASLFLNLIAAGSAAYAYARKKNGGFYALYSVDRVIEPGRTDWFIPELAHGNETVCFDHGRRPGACRPAHAVLPGGRS